MSISSYLYWEVNRNICVHICRQKSLKGVYQIVDIHIPVLLYDHCSLGPQGDGSYMNYAHCESSLVEVARPAC